MVQSKCLCACVPVYVMVLKAWDLYYGNSSKWLEGLGLDTVCPVLDSWWQLAQQICHYRRIIMKKSLCVKKQVATDFQFNIRSLICFMFCSGNCLCILESETFSSHVKSFVTEDWKCVQMKGLLCCWALTWLCDCIMLQGVLLQGVLGSGLVSIHTEGLFTGSSPRIPLCPGIPTPVALKHSGKLINPL